MDGIQGYKGYPAPPGRSRFNSAPSPLAINPAAVKTTSSYIRALRRRFWMVLAVAVPLAIASSIVVLKLPPVYMAKAEIEINPPELDPVLSTLVSHDPGRRDPSSMANYVPNHEAWLRSKWLAEKVVSDPSISAEMNQYDDPAFELFKTLSVQPVKKGGNSFIVSLEGKDPARTKKLLDLLLLEFQKQAKTESEDKLDKTAEYALENLTKLKNSSGLEGTTSLKTLDEKIESALKKTRTIGPGGRSILEEQYVTLGSTIAQKQLKLADIHQQLLTAEMFPKFDTDPEAGARGARIAELKRVKQRYQRGLDDMRRATRHFNSDPGAMRLARYLDDVMDELAELQSVRKEKLSTPTEMILGQYQRELEADREYHDQLLVKMQDSIPEHQRIVALLKDREEKSKQIVRMEDKLAEFAILRQPMVNNPCVKIPGSVVEPTVPIKPNRPMLIALGLCASLGLGIGLVCLLEHVDQSVKVPEHVSHGLTLPLLGVVPRIRRTALTQRGGHLWTLGTPDSIEADAYRNVRASLLGVADKRGPIVTLLVTSAKAGEGKSTTALNLAAACAMAGERTLLLDIDLRRPSLADVFIEDETALEVHGLVDVLRGELPWQRTVRHTEIPNLDFIPTGDTRAIPIEILGTLELRQLLIALSHHYDRVVLDGPAVLGLADCRVLGRIVDGSVLVVRSGSHQLMTLHRAKAMLEQSHVSIAGVVFNGLTEDMNNWSSYGYEPMSLPFGRLDPGASDGEPLALAASG
ncbi:MAG: polysaccharide biosynthesis tyrosine autokinase [Isosphaerales bacterium]